MDPYRTSRKAQLSINDLAFVGAGGKVAAIHRRTGKIAWSQTVSDGGAFVSILLDGDALFVGARGHLWCLDPLNGGQRWINELKGFGYGNVAIATARVASDQNAAIAAHEAAAAAAAATSG